MIIHTSLILAAVAGVRLLAQADEYREVALAAVSHYLSTQESQASNVVLEVFGDPVIFPDHEVWHLTQPGSSATVAGRVTDSWGAIVPGCRLDLSSRAGVFLDSSVSSPDGRFSFADLSGGEFVLGASLVGFSRSEVRFWLRDHEQSEVDLKLEAGPPELTISLRKPDLFQSGGSPPDLPGFMVLVLATQGREIRSFNAISGGGSYPVVDPVPENVQASELLNMTFREWESVVADLDEFYDIAVEIEAGMERFHPLIHDDSVFAIAQGMNLSEAEARGYVALYLDWMVLRVLRRIEQIELRSPIEEPGTEAEKLERQMQHHSQARSEYFEKLRQIGGDNIEHQEGLIPSIRKYLGEGLIGKIDLDGKEIYVTRMLPNANLLFSRIPGRLQIVGLVFRD